MRALFTRSNSGRYSLAINNRRPVLFDPATDPACCCGTMPPRTCDCTCITIMSKCGFGQEPTGCPCPEEFNFQITGVYSLLETTNGYDYGWYYDSAGGRHDWSADYPVTDESYTLRFDIRIQKRCVAGVPVFTYDGSTWDMTGVITQGGARPDQHLSGLAAWSAFVAFFYGLSWDELLCGVVHLPSRFLVAGVADITVGPECSGSGGGSTHFPDEGNGTADITQGYSWDTAQSCEGGHANQAASYDATYLYDLDTPGGGEHRNLETRGASNGAAAWSRTIITECATDPCQGVSPRVGACCGSFGFIGGNPCIDTTVEYCNERGGTWRGEGTSCATPSVPCPPYGACCLPGGGCVVTTQTDCTLGRHGVWNGPSTPCGALACPDQGACCLPQGECRITTAAHCPTVGGTFLGQGTRCGPNPCEQPLGACCQNGACNSLNQPDCVASGGRWFPGDCSTVTCPQLGACCLNAGACGCYDNTTFDECSALFASTGCGGGWFPGFPQPTCASIGCLPNAGVLGLI